jgi:hypothetical protein
MDAAIHRRRRSGRYVYEPANQSIATSSAHDDLLRWGEFGRPDQAMPKYGWVARSDIVHARDSFVYGIEMAHLVHVVFHEVLPATYLHLNER